MTLLSFFGDLLIAFGPSIAILAFYIGRHASLIILTLASAFIWLLSALLASLLWFAVVPWRDSQPWTIFTGVATQEVARWCFWLLLGQAERELNIIATHGPGSFLNGTVHAFTSGYGFGVFNGLVTYTTLLVSTIGPAVVFSRPCPETPMAFIAAFTTGIFILLNIVWAMLAFDAYRTRSLARIALVVVSHFTASYSTLFLSSSIPYGCIYGNLIPFFVLVPLAYLAWRDFDLVLAKERSRLRDLLPPPPPDEPEGAPPPADLDNGEQEEPVRAGQTEPHRRTGRAAQAQE